MDFKTYDCWNSESQFEWFYLTVEALQAQGEDCKKLKANHLTYCSEWNIFPDPTNCIIQFLSLALKDNKAGKCECKCSCNYPINCLFVAAAVLLGFGAIAQKLVWVWPDALIFFFLFFFFSLVCVCVLRQRASMSHHHHLDERWSHHQPSPITAAPPQVEGGVGWKCVTMTTTSDWSKWDQPPKNIDIFFL